MSKKIIFIIVGVVFLVVGAVVFVQIMGIGPFAPDEPEITTNDGGKTNKLDGNGKKSIPVTSIPIEPIRIPVIQKGKVALNLELEIQVEVEQAREKFLRKQLPLLEDAYVRDLFSFIPRQLRKNKKLDLETLNRRLKVIGQRVIGKGIISSVVVNRYSEAKPIDTSGKEDELTANDKEKKELDE